MCGLLDNYIEQLNKVIIDDEKSSEIDSILEDFSSMLCSQNNRQREGIQKKLTKQIFHSIAEENITESKILLLLALSDGFPDALEFLRKKGVFRASKYAYKTKILSNVIEFIKLTMYSKNEKLMGYLAKILLLLSIASQIFLEHKKIKHLIRSDERFLKTILAKSDIFFLKSMNEEDYSQTLKLGHITKETVISAVSYIVHVYREIHHKDGISSNWTHLINEANKDQSKYDSVIESALFICQYRELEFEVDIFDYDLKLFENKLWVEKDNFILPRCYGDTKTTMQSMARYSSFFQYNHDKIPSFKSMMERICDLDVNSGILHEIKEESIANKKLQRETRRIVCKIHYLPVDTLLKNSRVFFEELFLIYDLSLDIYTDNIPNIEIIGGVTIQDIIIIQRLYAYMSLLYFKVSENIKNTPGQGGKAAERLLTRSILPVMRKEKIVEMIKYVTGLSSEACEKIIDDLTLNLDDTNTIIDLQYTPIITSNKQYLMLPTILAYSKLIRSIAKKNDVNLSVLNNKKDQMITKLGNTFRDKDFLVLQDFPYGKDDIDLVLFKDDNLFIFECKNPYHPTDSYELGNTFEHIVKGFRQLTKFKAILSDKSKLKNFIAKTKFPIKPFSINIHYGIINANRALTGYSQEGCSVFHAAELINFVETGIISIKENQFFCWEEKVFSTKDLIKYLQGQVVSKDFIETAQAFEECYKYKGITPIIYKKFAFDFPELELKTKNKYISI